MRTSEHSGSDMERPTGLPTELPGEILPRPARSLDVRLRDGSVLVARQHGNPAGPRLFVSHGNGMAVDLYYPFWREFLDDFEVVVYDFRNHGWNPVSDLRRHRFASFVFDNESLLDAVNEAWGGKPAYGAFHSMSAVTALLQGLRVGPRWAGLVLFDPPLSPPLGHLHEETFLTGIEMIAGRAEARQSAFSSYAEFEAVLRRAPLFDALEEEVYALYAAATLRPGNAQGFELRCPREYEAHIYRSNIDATIDFAMGAFPSPLKVIGGDPTRDNVAPPSVLCAELFPRWGVDYEPLAGTSHFLQLEAPQACAQATHQFFARLGAA